MAETTNQPVLNSTQEVSYAVENSDIVMNQTIVKEKRPFCWFCVPCYKKCRKCGPSDTDSYDGDGLYNNDISYVTDDNVIIGVSTGSCESDHPISDICDTRECSIKDIELIEKGVVEFSCESNAGGNISHGGGDFSSRDTGSGGFSCGDTGVVYSSGDTGGGGYSSGDTGGGGFSCGDTGGGDTSCGDTGGSFD